MHETIQQIDGGHDPLKSCCKSMEKGGSKIRSDRKSKNNITEVCRVMMDDDAVLG